VKSRKKKNNSSKYIYKNVSSETSKTMRMLETRKNNLQDKIDLKTLPADNLKIENNSIVKTYNPADATTIYNPDGHDNRCFL